MKEKKKREVFENQYFLKINMKRRGVDYYHGFFLEIVNLICVCKTQILTLRNLILSNQIHQFLGVLMDLNIVLVTLAYG